MGTAVVHVWAGLLRRWAGLLLEYILSQGIGQILATASAFILVRAMPVAEYASYAYYLSLLSLSALFSDFGLTGSLSYFRRNCLQSKADFAPYILAVRSLRRTLLSLCAAIGSVVAAVLTPAEHLPSLLAIGGMIFGTAWAQSAAAINLHVLRLEGRLRGSYVCETAGSAARFGMAAFMAATAFATAWLGILGQFIGMATMLIATARLRGRKGGAAGPRPSGGAIKEVLRYIGPIAPGVAVFAVVDPTIIWLADKLGGPVVVAEVFAVGRIGALLGILGGFAVAVVVPRLTGVTDDRRFTTLCSAAFTAFAGLGALFLLLAYLMPGLFLGLLGERYGHLRYELLLTIAVSASVVLNALVVTTNRSRGWIHLEPAVAVLYLALVAALASRWDYSSAMRVLELQLCASTIYMLLNVCLSLVGRLIPGAVRAIGHQL